MPIGRLYGGFQKLKILRNVTSHIRHGGANEAHGAKLSNKKQSYVFLRLREFVFI
jgi:hypothetical protein